MINDIKNIKSSKSDIRKFGILVGSVLTLIGLILLWKELNSFKLFIILGVALISFGMILPKLLKPIYFVWMTIATILGWIMTRVILTILFYIILTPISLIARLFKVRFLDLTWNKDVESYWIIRSDKSINMEKQF